MGIKNISLPKELAAYLDAKVASGEYRDASEVLRDALRNAIALGEADICSRQNRHLTSSA
jgi:putative addiction module CopG family antidote